MKASEIDIGHLTDVGRKRTHNEDSFGFFRLGDDEVLAVVADGMGGHASGEVASRMAVEIIHEVYSKEREANDVLDALKSAFQTANFTILQKSLDQEDLKGMGTTATALVLMDGQTFLGHMGDSRAYLFRDETSSQLTKDHSMVERMVDQGLLSQEEAHVHPQRNVIYKTLGVNMDSDLQLLGPIPLFPSDILLLCSDGLTNLVTDQELLQTLRSDPPQMACERLIDLANQRGGHDNITVQVLKMKGAQKSRKPFLEGRRPLLIILAFVLCLLLIVNGLSLFDPDLLETIQKGIEGLWK